MRTPFSILACLLLAACGEVHGFTDAGGTGDDTQDADTTDALAAGAVDVTVLSRCCIRMGEPVPDAEVVSVDADGTPRDRAQTGAAGTATIEVGRGGSVTVVYPRGTDNQVHLVTIAAVEPGDSLTFGERFSDGTGASLGSMRVTWPAAANISNWNLYTNCGGWGYPATATDGLIYRYDYASCEATTDVVLVGYDTTVGAWARHGTLLDVAFVDGGVLGFSGTQLQTTSVRFEVSGLPPEIDYVYAAANPVLGETWLPGASIGGSPTGGSLSDTRQIAPVGDGMLVSVDLDRSGDLGYQYTRSRVPTGTTDLTWAPPRILPWVGPSAGSPAARTLTWIQLGDEPYDLAFLDLYWYDSTPLFGGVGTSYYWQLYVPPGIDKLVYPELPPELAAFLPPDDAFIAPYVQLIESDLYDGFAEARTHPEWDLRCPSCGGDYPTTTYSNGGSGGDLTGVLPGGWMLPRALGRARR